MTNERRRIQPRSMNSLFFLFSTGAWVSAALVLRSKNPVHSVFYLVLTFLHASGLLLLQGLEFFALLQLLVYIGALAIMFLFVVMLLDIPATEIVAHQRGTYPVAGLLFLTLLIAIFGVLWQPMEKSPFVTPLLPEVASLPKETFLETSWQAASTAHSPLAQLGVALYGVHVDLLLLASLLLLVAMMGAVALTLKRRVHAPLHDVFVQHSVDFQKVVSKVQA
uniref:NADH-ubiquinone oxidoreductase chain 6 n=1 Tax=Raphidocelis subcapitata TaxID=307507 RepID=A0A2Z6FBH3_9CHLO|nr:NADH-ubiquinone oxidoreductase chain 6 [Raphidocelis subcapitata]